MVTLFQILCLRLGLDLLQFLCEERRIRETVSFDFLNGFLMKTEHPLASFHLDDVDLGVHINIKHAVRPHLEVLTDDSHIQIEHPTDDKGRKLIGMSFGVKGSIMLVNIRELQAPLVGETMEVGESRAQCHCPAAHVQMEQEDAHLIR